MATIVPQAPRGPGAIDSGTQDLATVLGSAPQPGTIYVGTLILDAADRDDPTLVFGQAALSIDGHVVWGPSDMLCGGTDRNGNPVSPSFAWGNSGFGATTCRVTCDTPRRARIGLDVSTQPMVR